MRSYKLFILYFTLITVFTSCFPDANYPDEPAIEFESFSSDSTVGYLRIGFTDGDGDLGLNSSGADMQAPYDSGSFYHHNLYLIYMEKDDQNGWEVGKDLAGDSILFKYRVKRIQKNTESGLKGTIEIKIEPTYYNTLSDQSDTIKYRMKLIDRALNESNWVDTDPIIR